MPDGTAPDLSDLDSMEKYAKRYNNYVALAAIERARVAEARLAEVSR